ncbi:MAG: FtsK/SpoIIIE domain-containing protein, partial [Marmoricola sp.]
MKLKLTYHPATGSPVDLVVTTDATATIGDIAEEIRVCDPSRAVPAGGSQTLSVAGPGSTAFTALDPEATVGESSVTSGYEVRLTPAAASGEAAATSDAPYVGVLVEAGPEQGQRFRLRPGSHLIGRDPSCAVVLSDALVSKNHARLQVGEAVELVDLNSANGLLVDGGLVSRLNIVDGQAVTLGDTVIRFGLDSRGLASGRIQGGAVAHTRSPRVELRYPGQEFRAPDIPGEHDKPLFPWLLMIVPVLLGGALFAYTKNPLSLLFVAMSPMMMVANYVMGTKRANRARDSEIQRFDDQMEALSRGLESEVPREKELRAAEAPPVTELMSAGHRTGDLLWTRRPEHWSFLHLRLGVGRMPSRNRVADPAGTSRGLQEYVDQFEQLVARHRFVDDVPVVENLVSAGALGVVGPRETSHDLARGLLMQLVTLHSPAELVVAAITSVQAAAEYEWLKWLPHTSSPLSPVVGSHLAESAATAAALLAQLEELVDQRTAGAREVLREYRPPLEADVRASSAGARVGEEQGEWKPPELPVVVLLVTADAPVDSGRLIQLLERSGAADVYAIFVGTDVRELPAVCRTFVDTGRGLADSSVHFVRHGSVVTARADGVSRAAGLDVARMLSGVVDTGAFVADSSDLPRNVSMLSLLGPSMAESASAVVDRWRQNFSLKGESAARAARKRPPTLRALVGQAGADAMHLDLRSHGPHALVGGTTGAGKSEFLQAWVLGMAAEYSPDQVTFLFVDYKGGAAFSDCVALPHCVGLVTDLSPHLVVRVLASLRAELRHRERVLNRKKAKDLLELEKRGDPDCPPALVLVIDEFAALAGEVPE